MKTSYLYTKSTTSEALCLLLFFYTFLNNALPSKSYFCTATFLSFIYLKNTLSLVKLVYKIFRSSLRALNFLSPFSPAAFSYSTIHLLSFPVGNLPKYAFKNLSS